MKPDYLDLSLRVLIGVSGVLAAVLLSMKGYGQALPALAVGGTVGACFAARFQSSEQ